jgi:hypothetical protein
MDIVDAGKGGRAEKDPEFDGMSDEFLDSGSSNVLRKATVPDLESGV